MTTDAPAQQLPPFVQHLTGFYATQVLALGHDTGLLEAALAGAATAGGLAAKAGVDEANASLWAGAATVAGYLTCVDGVFTPAPALAMLFGGKFPFDVNAILEFVTGFARVSDQVSAAVRNGGGVPSAAFGAALGDSVTRINTPTYEACLVQDWLASVDGLAEQLAAGIDVADIACGAGDAASLVAGAFPASRVLGLDLNQDLIDRGRAAHADVSNLTLEACDVAALPQGRDFDLVYVLDALHHFPDPGAAVAAMAARLRPEGWLVVVESAASGDPTADAASPFSTVGYGAHLLYCTQDQMGQGGTGATPFLSSAWITGAVEQAGLTAAVPYASPSGMVVSAGRRPV